MYKKSPNKFIGSIAASAGSLAAGGGSSEGGIPDSVLNSLMGQAGQLSRALGTSRAAQAAATTGVGSVSPGIVDGVPSGAVGQVQDDRVQQTPPAVNEGAATGVGSIPSGAGGSAGSSNPFGGQKFQITPVQMTYDTPKPSNEMGNAKPLFNSHASNAGSTMFGDVGQRQRSLQNQAGDIQSSLFFKDQTGDGKITQADVIKARTEGYQK